MNSLTFTLTLLPCFILWYSTSYPAFLSPWGRENKKKTWTKLTQIDSVGEDTKLNTKTNKFAAQKNRFLRLYTQNRSSKATIVLCGCLLGVYIGDKSDFLEGRVGVSLNMADTSRSTWQNGNWNLPHPRPLSARSPYLPSHHDNFSLWHFQRGSR